MMRQVSKIGLIRLFGRALGEKMAPPILAKLPVELRPVYLAVGYKAGFFQANLDEYQAISESDRQVEVADLPEGLPLAVIRHGRKGMFSSLPAAEADQAEAAWEELQSRLAELSANSRLIVAERSGHNIALDEPEIIVGVIREMVESIRRGPLGKRAEDSGAER